MLCQMNLLLHGLESPEVIKGNSLSLKLTDISERDRVDLILTNPPFGGEEEKGTQSSRSMKPKSYPKFLTSISGRHLSGQRSQERAPARMSAGED